MQFSRASGILLHPTSLPGRFGIGDLGDAADHFLAFLEAAGQRLWQVMPLGPTGYGDSPYQSFSAFAGNPLLISLEALAADGLLTDADLASMPPLPAERVDFGAVIPGKWRLLRQAATRFETVATPAQRADFERFRADASGWLDDFALYMALKEAHDGAGWQDWQAPLRRREPAALAEALHRLAEPVRAQQVVQWLIARQWQRVRDAAHTRGIQIVGDIPIFVAADSADVWANPGLFHLDDAGRPTIVAGVPPDYFSATGQLWGNPLYHWDRLAADGYAWWVRRVRAALAQVDRLRIDHFRGFEAYWAVPAAEDTAIHGRWLPGPGAAFFSALRAGLGELPIIAEDLGLITPPVEALRDAFDLPGMAVLQFAFGTDAANTYLPHNHRRNLVVYTGTHDNDTTTGWYAQQAEAVRDQVRRYLGQPGDDIAWDFIRLALASVADTVIVPLQDVLSLGSEARMNLPGDPSGNWSWRCDAQLLTGERAARLADLVAVYGRDGTADRSHQAGATVGNTETASGRE
ncbi:MAG: 4-alpha-glucanotransferase [Chloroflexi bacterium]|nr:4-alpha-glucanotransferase [Chloroflexota bacterium]